MQVIEVSCMLQTNIKLYINVHLKELVHCFVTNHVNDILYDAACMSHFAAY